MQLKCTIKYNTTLIINIQQWYKNINVKTCEHATRYVNKSKVAFT